MQEVTPLSHHIMAKKAVIPSVLLFCTFLYLSFLARGTWYNGDDFIHLQRSQAVEGRLLEATFKGNFYRDPPAKDDHYRPFSNTIFGFLSKFGSSYIFKLFIYTMHCIVGLFLFLILYKISESNWKSCLGTLFFLFHPAISTNLFWTSAMADVLSTMFAIMVLYIFLVSEKKHLLLSCLLFLFGLLCKEMIITLPVILTIIACDLEPGRVRFKKMEALIALAGVGICFFVLRGMIIRSFLAGHATAHYFSFGTNTLKSITKYVIAIISPLPAGVIYKTPAWTVIYPFIFATLVLTSFFSGSLRKNLPAFFKYLIATAVSLLPVINFYASWYMYFVLIFFVLALMQLNLGTKTVSELVVFIVLIAMGVLLTTVNAGKFSQSAVLEKKILRNLAAIPERNIVLAAMPRSLDSIVPLMTYEQHTEAALDLFYKSKKKVQLIAPLNIENPERSAILNNGERGYGIHISPNDYDYFYDGFWGSYQEGKDYTILERNKFGKITKFLMQDIGSVKTYFYSNSRFIPLN